MITVAIVMPLTSDLVYGRFSKGTTGSGVNGSEGSEEVRERLGGQAQVGVSEEVRQTV